MKAKTTQAPYFNPKPLGGFAQRQLKNELYQIFSAYLVIHPTFKLEEFLSWLKD